MGRMARVVPSSVLRETRSSCTVGSPNERIAQVKPESKAPTLPVWRWALIPGAGLAVLADISIVVWKKQEAAAFAVAVLLAWLAWMVLLDRDVCRKAGQGREVFTVHITALVFGATTGVMPSLLREHARVHGLHLEALLLLFVILSPYGA